MSNAHKRNWAVRRRAEYLIVMGVLAGQVELYPFHPLWPFIRWLQLRERVSRLRLMNGQSEEVK